MPKVLLPLIVTCLLVNCTMTIAQDQLGTIQETAEKSVYKIEFPGGPLPSFIKLVKKMEDEDGQFPQIVVTESARDFVLPEIEVTTNFAGAAGIMTACSTDSTLVNLSPDDSGNVWIAKVERFEQPQMVILNVKRILEKVDQESMLSAITVGMDMLGPSEKVQLKLHKETGLFFAKGSGTSCQLVTDIIAQLEIGGPIQNRSESNQPSQAWEPK